MVKFSFRGRACYFLAVLGAINVVVFIARHGTQQQRSAEPLRQAPVQRTSRLAYVLLGSGRDEVQLERILWQIRHNLLPWTPGDVLFFHTGEYDSAEQQQLVLKILPQANISRIPREAWTLPDGLREEDAPRWKYARCCPYPMHGIGYRHMCRWYSNGVFKYAAAHGYDWVLRLDEDSQVLTPVQQDMAAWMEAHGKLYGMRLWDNDGPEVTWSLPELTAWFITAHDVQPTFLYDDCRPRSVVGLHSRGGWRGSIIFNNMFLANVSWWLSDPVQAYLGLVERSQGYYLYRWGDAPVHTMVVSMFLRRDQVHTFGFGYAHKEAHDAARAYWGPALQDAPP